MKTEKSWWANIYVGTYCKDTQEQFSIERLRWIAQDYCNEIGFCVTFTPTEFIYTNGSEPGAIVGCIQYPRFPMADTVNKDRAIALAKRLMESTKQCRVSIVMPDEVVMLSKEDGDV